jgi:hypothetical protein
MWTTTDEYVFYYEIVFENFRDLEIHMYVFLENL